MPSFPLVFVPTTSSTATGFARSQYRPQLLRDVGYFATGTVLQTMSGLEADRFVVSAQFRSDTTPPSRYDGMFLYVTQGAQAGQQRALVDGSFDGSEGLFAVDYPYTSTLTAGDTFEISELPAEDYLGISGANLALDQGLEMLPVVHVVDIPAIAETTEYVLTDYPWPIMGIGDVYAPRTSTTDRRLVVNGTRFVTSADTPTLVLPYSFNDGDTFTVQLRRPASTWIRQSGAWGDADGLTSDTDEALYSVTNVVRAATPFALDFMAQRYGRTTKERAALEADAADARSRAALGRFFGGQRGSSVQRVGAVRQWDRRWWW